MTSPFRRRVETSAGPLVVMLARLPKIAPFLIVLALLVAGLVVGGVLGGLLLAALAALLALLLFLGWPALDPPARMLRLAVIALVVMRALTLALD